MGPDHAADAHTAPWPSSAGGSDPEPPSSDSERAQPETRLCASCGKTTQVLDPSEYTPQRAALILQHGLCVCPTTTPGGQDSDSAADLLS